MRKFKIKFLKKFFSQQVSTLKQVGFKVEELSKLEKEILKKSSSSFDRRVKLPFLLVPGSSTVPGIITCSCQNKSVIYGIQFRKKRIFSSNNELRLLSLKEVLILSFFIKKEKIILVSGSLDKGLKPVSLCKNGNDLSVIRSIPICCEKQCELVIYPYCSK